MNTVVPGDKEPKRGEWEYKAVIYETGPRRNERPWGQRTTKRRDTDLFWPHREISRNKCDYACPFAASNCSRIAHRWLIKFYVYIREAHRRFMIILSWRFCKWLEITLLTNHVVLYRIFLWNTALLYGLWMLIGFCQRDQWSWIQMEILFVYIVINILYSLHFCVFYVVCGFLPFWTFFFFFLLLPIGALNRVSTTYLMIKFFNRKCISVSM